MKLKRILTIFLFLTLLTGLFPLAAIPVRAVDAVEYIERGWDGSAVTETKKTVEDYTVVDSGTIIWESGWYVVIGSVNVSDRITVTGDVHLILCDGYTLNAAQGITVAEGNSLTIYGQTQGTGALKVFGIENCAGIGGVDGGYAATADNVKGTIVHRNSDNVEWLLIEDAGDVANGTNQPYHIVRRAKNDDGSYRFVEGERYGLETLSRVSITYGQSDEAARAAVDGALSATTVDNEIISAVNRGSTELGNYLQGHLKSVITVDHEISYSVQSISYKERLGNNEITKYRYEIHIYLDEETVKDITSFGHTSSIAFSDSFSGSISKITKAGFIKTVTQTIGYQTVTKQLLLIQGDNSWTALIRTGENGRTKEYGLSMGDGPFGTPEARNSYNKLNDLDEKWFAYLPNEEVTELIALNRIGSGQTVKNGELNGAYFENTTNSTYRFVQTTEQDGSCGTIKIYGGSVTAIGGTCGAGIGGGRGSDSGTVTIYGGTVTATDTNGGASIGGGDGGSLDGLQLDGMKVYAPKDATTPVTADKREEACKGVSVKIIECTDHSESFYTDNDDGTHTASCKWCTTEGTTEDHTYEDGTCKLCGTVEVAGGTSSPSGLSRDNDGYYIIEDYDDLLAFANMVNSSEFGFEFNAKLTDHIEAKGKTDWTPIGKDDIHSYTGTFDGQGFEIRDLTYQAPEQEEGKLSFAGLFGHNSGIVMSVTMQGGSIGGDNCVGGIAGYNYGTIKNCCNTGEMNGNYTGGIAGVNLGVIENCFNTSKVQGDYAGGISGNNIGVDAKILNCYNNGDVTGSLYAGGIVGSNEAKVENCYSAGDMSGRATFTGGVIGSNNNVQSDVKNCYYDTTKASGLGAIGFDTGNPVNIKGLTTAQMTGEAAKTNMSALFADTNVDENGTPVWVTVDGDYPELAVFGIPLPTVDGVKYYDPTEENEDDRSKTRDGCIPVTDKTTKLENGKWYVVNSNVTIDNRITVSGKVNLILADKTTLTVNGGIRLEKGNTLTIWAQSEGDNMGKLNSTGYDLYHYSGSNQNIFGAGIGGDSGYIKTGMTSDLDGHDCGELTINGGEITATGEGGAGIGGGYGGHNDISDRLLGDGGNGGKVTINGGKVKAHGIRGAGIGGGMSVNCKGGTGGTVVITGGTVEATGDGSNRSGAGIGGGCGGGNASDDGSGGDVTITGGTVTAEAWASAGIGGAGYYGDGGTVTITGGTVTATGHDSSYEPYKAIGGGKGAKTDGSLTIAEGMRVYAEGSSVPVAMDMRKDTCHQSWAKIENCEKHSGTTFTNNGDDTHSATCDYCGTKGSSGPHVFGDNYTCICGAHEKVPYYDPAKEGDNPFCETWTAVTASQIFWEGGKWYVVNEDVTIDNRFGVVSGTVNVILVDGCTLTATQGITVGENTQLIIWAQSDGNNMGKLLADCSSIETNSAAIGAFAEYNTGTIIINGGYVKAIAYRGAGIGSGTGGGASGSVTINGGAVDASSSQSAGIGGGQYSGGSDVTINGGTVTVNTEYFPSTQAIGYGMSGSTAGPGNLTIANGMRVFASKDGTEPVLANKRVDSCRGASARIEPCTVHDYSSGGTCKYCNLADPNPKVTVTFHKNDGTTATATQDVYKGKETLLTSVDALTGFTWRGHTFAGWNTEKDGSGTKYADKASVTLSAGFDLYAQWTQNQPAVTTSSELSSFTYNGIDQTPFIVSVKDGNADLTANQDYTIQIKKRISGNPDTFDIVASAVDVGLYSLVVTFDGDYKDATAWTFDFKIDPASIKDAKVTLNPNEAVYTGNAIDKPTETVKIVLCGKEITLKKGTDYTVSYGKGNWTDAATYKVTIKGDGNYTDSKEESFTIKPASIKDAKVTLNPKEAVYTGNAIDKPTETVKIDLGGKEVTLEKEKDYTVSYGEGNWTTVGTYTVTIIGNGNYNQETSATFNINTPDKDELGDAIEEADNFYKQIKDQYPDIAEELKQIIDDAKDKAKEQNITESAVETLKDAVNDAITKAENKKNFEDQKDTAQNSADGLSKNGDSDAVSNLIDKAKEDIEALLYDTDKSPADNKARVDSILTTLETALATQREADFTDHKENVKDAVEDQRKAGDSDEVTALINAAKDKIEKLPYDDEKTPGDNEKAVDDILTTLKTALNEQREEEKSDFADQKDEAKDTIEDQRKTGDSDAVKKLIDDAEKALEELKYDEDKTPAENEEAVDKILSDLEEALNEQRTDEKSDFTDYKDDALDTIEDLRKAGDSEDVKTLIDDAEKALNDLQYDEELTPDKNKEAVDAILTKLEEKLSEQRTEEKDDFDDYKDEAKDTADHLLWPDDSRISRDLVDKAKDQIDELGYDEKLTPAENAAAVDAILEKLIDDLSAQREKEAQDEAERIRRLFESIRIVRDMQKKKEQSTPTTPISPEEPAALPFTDVPTDFEPIVRYVYERDIMNGVSTTLFNPFGILTRGMIVTILHRMEGEPATPYTGAFSDVPAGEWYTQGVEWAAAHDIVLGFGNGTYGPEKPVTREQLAAILFRYAQFKGYPVTTTTLTSFSSAGVSPWATEYVAWAMSNGILLPDESDGSARGTSAAVRWEVAAAVKAFLEKYKIS